MSSVILALAFCRGQAADDVAPVLRVLKSTFKDILGVDIFPFPYLQTDQDLALGNAWFAIFCHGHTVSTYNTIAEYMLVNGKLPKEIATIQGPPWMWDIWHFRRSVSYS